MTDGSRRRVHTPVPPMPAPLLIADVPWLLYRAFFALPKSIVDGEGRPVNALLGTVNALLVAIEARPPRAVVACMGAEQAAYRVELYPPYHAHRDPMPPELARQWQLAPALLASLGWTVQPERGARGGRRDVLLRARRRPQAGGRALLLTGDRDLFQAVGEHTAILELRKGGRPRGGRARSRCASATASSPELVPDFIALRGDPSDGLPGAPGIGAKTAAELLQRHGSLEGALHAARGIAAQRRATADRGGAARERAAAARLQADRDARADRRAAPAGPSHGLRRRRRERAASSACAASPSA